MVTAIMPPPPAALVVDLSIAVAAGREVVGVTTSISILGGDVIGVTRGRSCCRRLCGQAEQGYGTC